MRVEAHAETPPGRRRLQEVAKEVVVLLQGDREVADQGHHESCLGTSICETV